MYTLVFKLKSNNGCVFDVYHTNEHGKQRIVGNIYCYHNHRTGPLHQSKREIIEDSKQKDMLDFHTIADTKEYEIPAEIKRKLYDRAERIFREVWSYL